MTQPTPEEYASFGAAVAGIMDVAEEQNADPAFTVSMIRLAASTYNIEPVKHV